jgi:hypothetical protein
MSDYKLANDCINEIEIQPKGGQSNSYSGTEVQTPGSRTICLISYYEESRLNCMGYRSECILTMD